MKGRSKVLVVYYSKTGNTERVAKDVAATTNAEIEKIIDKKNRQGVWGYLFGGRDALKKYPTEIQTPANDPANYDLVVIGTPVWGWSLTPAVRTYLNTARDNIHKYAFFVTSDNTGPERTVQQAKEIINQDPIACVGFTRQERNNQEVYNQKLAVFTRTLKSSN